MKKFHAKKTGEILSKLNYDFATIERVQSLNLKKNLKTDRECQTIEDALCLVFLQHQLKEMAAKITKEKLYQILKKTWRKMSANARVEASKLSFSPKIKSMINEIQAD